MLTLFLTIWTPKQLVLSTLSMINVSHLDNPQCFLALPALRNTNATTHKHQCHNKQNTNTIIKQFQEDAYFTVGTAAISPQMHYTRIENMWISTLLYTLAFHLWTRINSYLLSGRVVPTLFLHLLGGGGSTSTTSREGVTPPPPQVTGVWLPLHHYKGKRTTGYHPQSSSPNTMWCLPHHLLCH